MYILYGSEVSLYTGKIRAYLKYKQLPFTEVLSTVSVYKKIIRPKTGVTFIPVVKTPSGEYLQDTARIIDNFEAQTTSAANGNNLSVVPTTPAQQLVSELFALWGDEWLVIPAMHYRWNKDNFPFIYEEFGQVVTPKAPKFIKAYFGKKLAKKFQGFVPLLGITEKSIPYIEDWYENTVLHYLNEHFATHKYLLGDKPCTGDFGLLGPLYAHLYRDPAPKQLMDKLAPNVAAWVKRMNNPGTAQQASTSASNDINNPNFIENDEIPATLLPLLKDMFTQQWPVLKSTSEALTGWREKNASNENTPHFIPRTIGQHNFKIGRGETGYIEEQRFISSFHQYKLQRVLDVFHSIEQPSLELTGLLEEVGGLEYMRLELKDRVAFKGNRLVFG
ncbi:MULTISPECIES: glutathione S-transferase family protein [Alteromonas]|uniref:glutathione S-transferase family protein n=1 Tax=Alteromonas TaxID=226 RepID=UPI0026E46DDF|nr:glutathione S-transferase family protein [Alteromonas stellipolaris]MDO6535235.1 glutathione S-transferase family protein [Alteromonas stellipolaris]MDO6627111.1 glutathione S-transferase family protein [Alteromonas stellipolaris]